jgi:hypothetical protein
MTPLTFDTLQFVQRLKKAGIKDEEAVAIAEAVRDVQANADLATKSDLKRDLAETKVELIKWVVTVGVLQTSIIAALVMKLIPS